MPTFSESFSQTLRQLRLAAGLSQQEIADRLHISRSAYTYYEIGRTQPTLENLVRIAEILNQPIDALLPEAAPNQKEKAS